MKAYVVCRRCYDYNDEPFERLEETEVTFDPETAKKLLNKQFGGACDWLYDVDYGYEHWEWWPDENTCSIIAESEERREKYLCLITLREVEVI